ncbi:hypothetical protein DID88_007625 [Monilinia fructigena]|uniref:BAH domain-containing protein n=1 Tax=Monilinia fructigena TaxID=38457 RepID=A0A395J2Z2_9HELO|nr:hypothetical protein DID88_007625 [Monilinia fructigena]
MAPKHGRNSSSTPSTKRVKKESSRSSSVTPPPAVQDAVAFSIKYPIMNPMDGNEEYNNFIIQSETYKSNETVYVKGKTEAGIEPKDFWVARVLQVRASNPQHVYALVAWMYWPEELEATAKAADEVSPAGGRRKYHGSAELIASNYLDVVDVTSFAGKVEIVHFSEEVVDDAVSEPNLKKFYWRQTFCRGTNKLSDLPVYCICNGHYNPDLLEYEHVCDNEACKTLYHSECLVEDTLTKKVLRGIPSKWNGASNQ